jgi:hypothetical protein
MRTDVQIDKRYVYCPNASTLGYGKYRAQFGDFLMWREATYAANDLETKTNPHCHMCYGRMAGRIHYAPAICDDTEPVRDWILAIALGSNLTFAMERWVDPSEVVEVFEPTAKLQSFLNYFLSEQFKQEKPNTLRAWSTSGFSTMQEYQNYLNSRSVRP